jgi:Tol biopolymer transport system component
VQPLGSRDSVQLTPDTADHIQPRFSPDGEHIAFASNRGGDWDIWVMRRDGTGLIPLANDPAAEFSPCWSPDGTQIAFSVWSRRARTWEIWGCPVARPAARRLITTGMCPAWSPDGTCLAVQRAPQGGDRAFEIWTVDVASGNARRIAEKHGAACLAPRWSPDGKALLYCAVPTTVSAAGAGRDSPEIAELWTVDVRTGAEVRLPAAQGASFSPAWAADGRIFFVSGMSGTERIWSLAPETALLASGQSASGREHIITTRFTAID